MTQIPYYFDNVRRSALVIKPKKVFFDWLRSLEKDFEPHELLIEGDVYLLPDYEEIKQMENWLKKHFDDIFSDQLNNWYTDERLWPQNRTFAMFKDWFDYSMYTMIWDTQDKFIEKV